MKVIRTKSSIDGPMLSLNNLYVLIYCEIIFIKGNKVKNYILRL